MPESGKLKVYCWHTTFNTKNNSGGGGGGKISFGGVKFHLGKYFFNIKFVLHLPEWASGDKNLPYLCSTLYHYPVILPITEFCSKKELLMKLWKWQCPVCNLLPHPARTCIQTNLILGAVQYSLAIFWK